MGVYILWFLLCITGIGLCILTLITANQRMPKVQGVCALLGSVLLLGTLALSVYDIQTKPALDTYFMGRCMHGLLITPASNCAVLKPHKRYIMFTGRLSIEDKRPVSFYTV